VLLVRPHRTDALSLRSGRRLRTNAADLVMQAVIGEIGSPIGRTNAYRIGNDGVPRVLPGPGGISINRRIGDRCVGLAADHIEPGVSLRNHQSHVGGAPDGPNLALMTSACIGNLARVMTGDCRGATGLVTAKHGGVNHVLVDFDDRTLARLSIGDRVQIYSCGLGLALPDFPEVTLHNCSPGLLRRWDPTPRGGALEVRVTHLVPAEIIGSGRGQNTVSRADFDIELFDPDVRRRYRLDTLRFGDLVCVKGADSRFGFSVRHGHLIFGIIAHSDSTVSGHGPGVVALMTGPVSCLRPIYDINANIAKLYQRRRLASPRRRVPVAGRALPLSAYVRSRPLRRLDTARFVRHRTG
jgi:Domain of unknown function (DUF4438)